MKEELEQFKKDLEIIRRFYPELYPKLLAKFYVEVIPLLSKEDCASFADRRT